MHKLQPSYVFRKRPGSPWHFDLFLIIPMVVYSAVYYSIYLMGFCLQRIWFSIRYYERYPKGRPYKNPGPKLKRNWKCPCGSGKKVKNCHGKKVYK